MIVTEFFNGQGLGNQLWSYVVARVLAEDRGWDFGIISPKKFKGRLIFDLDYGVKLKGGISPYDLPSAKLPRGIENYYFEKDIWYEKYQCDIRDFDPGLLKLLPNTKIDGYFQSEKYIAHKKSEIASWLKLRPEYEVYEYSADDICVLNVRGGEYKGNPDLILRREYWTNAVKNMLKFNRNLKFIVVTDDVIYAKELLPEYEVHHFDIGRDYSIIKNAHYLILSNSSFAFFPAWTNTLVKKVIAPKYWARHNISDGFWSCTFNLYADWYWQDRDGVLFSYKECLSDLEHYEIMYELKKMPAKKNGKYVPPSLISRVKKQTKIILKKLINEFKD